MGFIKLMIAAAIIFSVFPQETLENRDAFLGLCILAAGFISHSESD